MAEHKHKDATVKLDMPFDEAIRKLASTRKGSRSAESDSTKSDAGRSPAPRAKRSAPRPKSSAD